MYQLIKKSKTGSTRFVQTILFEPSSKTHAASVLLNDYYRNMDEDYLESFDGRMRRIKFSRDTLTDWQQKLGKLTCVYCEKTDLQIEYDGMQIDRNVMATLEHLLPISKCGGIFDIFNVVCACGKCNHNRSSKDLDTYLKGRNIDKNEFDIRCQAYFELNK